MEPVRTFSGLVTVYDFDDHQYAKQPTYVGFVFDAIDSEEGDPCDVRFLQTSKAICGYLVSYFKECLVYDSWINYSKHAVVQIESIPRLGVESVSVVKLIPLIGFIQYAYEKIFKDKFFGWSFNKEEFDELQKSFERGDFFCTFIADHA